MIFGGLSETNREGHLYIPQPAVKQRLLQKTGGSVTCLTSVMVHHPSPARKLPDR